MIGFDRDRARDLTTTLELRLRFGSARRLLPLALRIESGRLHVRPGAPANASASATMQAVDVLRLATGRVGWPELLASGRLQLHGDPFLALRFPTLFRLPASRRGRLLRARGSGRLRPGD